ncbi:MAG: hypothetical protein ABIB43_00360 [archaeon]
MAELDDIVIKHIDIYRPGDKSAEAVTRVFYPIEHIVVKSIPFINWKFNRDYAVDSKSREAIVDVYNRLEKKLIKHDEGNTAVVTSEIVSGKFYIKAELFVDIYNAQPLFT